MLSKNKDSLGMSSCLNESCHIFFCHLCMCTCCPIQQFPNSTQCNWPQIKLVHTYKDLHIVSLMVLHSQVLYVEHVTFSATHIQAMHQLLTFNENMYFEMRAWSMHYLSKLPFSCVTKQYSCIALLSVSFIGERIVLTFLQFCQEHLHHILQTVWLWQSQQ